MDILKDKKTEILAEAILALKTPNETRRFLRDLLTESEIAEFGNRFAVARMLDEAVPYSSIVRQTGLSSTTVARVSKWLNTGMNGYRTIIDRLNLNHHHLSHARAGKGLSLHS